MENNRPKIDPTGRPAGSGGKIFVGGLSRETTTEDLTNYFGKYGTVADAVAMTDRTTGQPRGFGFVTFSDPATIDLVMAEKHTINEWAVEVKRSVPRERMDAVRSGPKTKKIFIGGLSSNVTDDELKAYFARYGQIVDHIVMKDNSTGAPRGFGFVTFETEQAVDDLLLEGKTHVLGDKEVEIKKAEPKGSLMPRSFEGGGGRGYGGGRGGGGYYNEGGRGYGERESYGGGMGGGGYGGGGGYRSGGGYGGAPERAIPAASYGVGAGAGYGDAGYGGGSYGGVGGGYGASAGVGGGYGGYGGSAVGGYVPGGLGGAGGYGAGAEAAIAPYGDVGGGYGGSGFGDVYGGGIGGGGYGGVGGYGDGVGGAYAAGGGGPIGGARGLGGMGGAGGGYGAGLGGAGAGGAGAGRYHPYGR
eukprot:TRINITY_DN6428_c0_g1_i1.p1 TRINITY_DN6428_c0_g1~~TRINITY_DN6428_c0_g1_i1.p1  ORF type:complete len:415 (+),score=71.40 TRINITY_DN6428_c0_g1_i1:395-1639(+)